MTSVIKHAFLLDSGDMSIVANQFTSASEVAACASAVYSVSYECDYDQLDALRTAILSAVDLEPAVN